MDRPAVDRHLERVALHRLLPDDVAQVVSPSLGGEAVLQKVLDAVVVGSEGLPFLAEEVLETLLATGTLVRQGASGSSRSELRLTVPGSFALDVRRRMNPVDTYRAVVQAAAVLGEDFDWRTLILITALDEVR